MGRKEMFSTFKATDVFVHVCQLYTNCLQSLSNQLKGVHFKNVISY